MMFTSIKLPREQKEALIRSLQTYFEEERSETIGELGAETLIDFMIGELGPYMYNQALADARKLIQEKMAQIDDELYAIEKPIRTIR
ncbi:DUF2164 domain-containing protein [Paenibacillus sp. R14(2021)]|uniref:DUF2164 domain-containing protein n=1 Tax=Paenibacillus sp. R14(2021) TaxID=2859228 RepID=UPI00280A86DB|nr:DUF2164 domain-containing protein [Paenibacillus sp. R14(2021)]